MIHVICQFSHLSETLNELDQFDKELNDHEDVEEGEPGLNHPQDYEQQDYKSWQVDGKAHYGQPIVSVFELFLSESFV